MKRTPLRSRPRVRPGWWQVRKFIASRADERCEANAAEGCTRRGAHAHHIVPRSQGGGDEPGNLLWVCAPCHETIHHYPTRSYEHGWLRHHWEGVR